MEYFQLSIYDIWIIGELYAYSVFLEYFFRTMDLHAIQYQRE